MIAVPHKAKQYLLVSAKVLMIGLSFGYIFYKIGYNESLGFSEFMGVLASRASISGYLLGLFFIMAVANWYFEILKWQSLVSTIQKINFTTAMKQSLASLTVSLATPNRIGEYGAKAFFFESQQRKKVLLLQFFSSGSQMFATTFFGIIGLFYFHSNFSIGYSVQTLCSVGIGAILLFAVGYYFKEKELLLKGFSFSKAVQFFRQIPFPIKRNALLFSFCRYFIFSSMFYGMLLFFGAEIVFFEGLLLIFTMYLFVSIIPTFFILDVVIRGGVAVWLFSFVNVPELAVLATVLTIWIFNFALPALLGSFFVLTYQPLTR